MLSHSYSHSLCPRYCHPYTLLTANNIMSTSLAATRDSIVTVSVVALKTLFNTMPRRSSTSSISSISSLSSISSIESTDQIDSRTTDTSKLRLQVALEILEATSQSLYIRRWEETSIAKCSQLPLVLEYFKSHDLVRFRRNLRVNPSTFDAYEPECIQCRGISSEM